MLYREITVSDSEIPTKLRLLLLLLLCVFIIIIIIIIIIIKHSVLAERIIFEC